MDQRKGIIHLLEKEKDRLTKELRGITAALAAFGKAYANRTGRRQLFVEARARISLLLNELVGRKLDASRRSFRFV